jgi:hypothetical protein
MVARFLAGFALGAFILVMLLAAVESRADIKIKFNHEPVKCRIFCTPLKR